jgi:hypothetical protein
MLRRKPDLIVPVRDRRQRKRYFTLKNFRNAAIVGVVAFIGISIRSELRSPDPNYYSPLYQRVLPKVDQKKAPLEVVTEKPQPVPDAEHADPMLVGPMAREQWLHGEAPAAAATTATMLPSGATRAEAAVATGETRVAIVGGSEGVALVQQTRRKPVLAGGFGRK